MKLFNEKEKLNVMKKNWILLLVSGLFIVSCTNVKDSKEYKELQAQRDSLLMRSAGAESEAAEMMAVISEVEANLSGSGRRRSISLPSRLREER